MDVSAVDLSEAAAAIFAEPVTIRQWQGERIAYESGSPATGGLLRVHGTTTDGRTFRVFVKLVQHARHWPRLHLLPAYLRDSFAAQFPWRQELAAWDTDFAGRLPAGLRVPVLYRVADVGDDRLMLYMEDIDACADSTWDLPRFERAATLLGGLAALRGTAEAIAANPYAPGWGLRGYIAGRVQQGALPLLDDDGLWRHPLLAEADPDLRSDLRRLARALPAILDRLDALPQAVPHGDASPQNLLIPRDEPDALVAIDISFQGPHAVGFDLGQLLIGLAHAGLLDVGLLADVHDVLVPAFLTGLRAYGGRADADEVTYGYVGSLVARAAFTSLPFELLGAPATPETEAVFRQRLALTRFLADLGATLR
ncbi:MAG: aminoglycoside phosphotransferase [Hamadaea sp.]|nr:aminoglycoside phosphotransferase [Hamadaea sp.]NUT06316.1 aminoglycoside phosphotransferase [Hamadaea sp.]